MMRVLAVSLAVLAALPVLAQEAGMEFLALLEPLQRDGVDRIPDGGANLG